MNIRQKKIKSAIIGYLTDESRVELSGVKMNVDQYLVPVHFCCAVLHRYDLIKTARSSSYKVKFKLLYRV
jgi:hypothetical protein